MLTTPLTHIHHVLGAKMAPFAGYDMPISYTTISEEHEAVRSSVGIFDVTHMGEFIIRGKQALDLVQKVTSNDASKLKIGDAQYSCMPNHDCGIVDDLLVYRLPEDMCSEGEQAFLLVVNASNMDKDWAWIAQNNSYDTRMINISSQTGLVAVQGPMLQPHYKN
jgi:aminomethyltransferase